MVNTHITSLLPYKDEKWASFSWHYNRKFCTRLIPEYNWQTGRKYLLEEIQQELSNKKRDKFYFIAPSSQQRQALQSKQSVTFAPKNREMFGFTAAHALAELTTYIRLEKEGETLDLLQGCFNKLWAAFAQSKYGRSYETSKARSAIVYTLINVDVFDLVANKEWEIFMRNYFMKSRTDWYKELLIDKHPMIVKALFQHFKIKETHSNFLKGLVDFTIMDDDAFIDLSKGLLIASPNFDSCVVQNPANEIFYILPYQLIRFEPAYLGYKLWKLSTFKGGNTPNHKLKAYFFQNLCNRTELIDLLEINKTYTLKQVMHLAEMDEFTVLMAIGNLIKTSLMTFDKENGKDWKEINQEYILKEKATVLKK